MIDLADPTTDVLELYREFRCSCTQKIFTYIQLDYWIGCEHTKLYGGVYGSYGGVYGWMSGQVKGLSITEKLLKIWEIAGFIKKIDAGLAIDQKFEFAD